MSSDVLTLIVVAAFAGLLLFVFFVFRHAEHTLLFSTKKTFKGRWNFWGSKIKEGRIDIGDQRYVVKDRKPYIMEHPLFGHVPTYIFLENNPEPIDLTDKVPKSSLTATAVKKMARMQAVEKIMEGGKKDFFEMLIFIAMGALIGALLVFALLYMGVISVPVGTCLSDPNVIAAFQNMTQTIGPGYQGG